MQAGTIFDDESNRRREDFARVSTIFTDDELDVNPSRSPMKFEKQSI